jgi:hypothetical protein
MNDVDKIKIFREYKKFKEILFKRSLSSVNYILDDNIFNEIELYINEIENFFITSELYNEYCTFNFYDNKTKLYVLSLDVNTNLCKKLKKLYYTDENLFKAIKIRY